MYPDINLNQFSPKRNRSRSRSPARNNSKSKSPLPQQMDDDYLSDGMELYTNYREDPNNDFVLDALYADQPLTYPTNESSKKVLMKNAISVDTIE